MMPSSRLRGQKPKTCVVVLVAFHVCVSISGSMCECIYEPLYHAIPYYNIYTYMCI